MDRVATVVVVCPLGENTDILEVDVREHARPRVFSYINFQNISVFPQRAHHHHRRHPVHINIPITKANIFLKVKNTLFDLYIILLWLKYPRIRIFSGTTCLCNMQEVRNVETVQQVYSFDTQSFKVRDSRYRVPDSSCLSMSSLVCTLSYVLYGSRQSAS